MRARLLPLLFLFVAGLTPADDLETTVARMARIGSASSPSFSPDGARLAFVSNLGGLPQVWSVPVEGGWPEAVTALDDPVGFVEWSPDGSQLAFTLAPGGGMNEQVYLVRPDGTGLKRLTAGGKETNRLSGFTHDGRELVLGGNTRDGNAIDAYLLGVADGAARGATRSGGINGYTDVSRDGKTAVLSRLVSRGDNNLQLVDLATGKETLLTPHEDPAASAAASSLPTAGASICRRTRAASSRRSPASSSTRRAGPARSS
jgi:Tol biopolymer transport system component